MAMGARDRAAWAREELFAAAAKKVEELRNDPVNGATDADEIMELETQLYRLKRFLKV